MKSSKVSAQPSIQAYQTTSPSDARPRTSGSTSSSSLAPTVGLTSARSAQATQAASENQGAKNSGQDSRRLSATLPNKPAPFISKGQIKLALNVTLNASNLDKMQSSLLKSLIQASHDIPNWPQTNMGIMPGLMKRMPGNQATITLLFDPSDKTKLQNIHFFHDSGQSFQIVAQPTYGMQAPASPVAAPIGVAESLASTRLNSPALQKSPVQAQPSSPPQQTLSPVPETSSDSGQPIESHQPLPVVQAAATPHQHSPLASTTAQINAQAATTAQSMSRSPTVRTAAHHTSSTSQVEPFTPLPHATTTPASVSMSVSTSEPRNNPFSSANLTSNTTIANLPLMPHMSTPMMPVESQPFAVPQNMNFQVDTHFVAPQHGLDPSLDQAFAFTAGHQGFMPAPTPQFDPSLAFNPTLNPMTMPPPMLMSSPYMHNMGNNMMYEQPLPPNMTSMTPQAFAMQHPTPQAGPQVYPPQMPAAPQYIAIQPRPTSGTEQAAYMPQATTQTPVNNKKRKTLTPDDDRTIYQMSQNKAIQADIAAVVGIERSTVSKHLKQIKEDPKRLAYASGQTESAIEEPPAKRSQKGRMATVTMNNGMTITVPVESSKASSQKIGN